MDPSQLGVDTGGVWTTAEALTAGLTKDQVDHRLHTGEWQRLHRGVHTHGGCTADARMRGWAAVLAAGGRGRAWAAGRTTARLLGLPLLDDPEPTSGRRGDDVAVLSGRRPATRPGLHVSRLSLVAGDTVRVGGCPSLSPARALPGLTELLSQDSLVCLLDAALHRSLVSADDLEHLLTARAGRNGTDRLRTAVRQADGRAESPAETLARLLLLPALPALVPQVRLLDRQRVVARFDLADECLRLAVETDGLRGHAGTAMVAKDRRRDRAAEALGWTVERCTWSDLRQDRDALVRRVLATAERLRRTAAQPVERSP
jgi:very-short-patch-repair endonuclease